MDAEEIKIKNCLWCNAKPVVNVFISQWVNLPKPIKLFGRWSLVKMRHKDIPINYCVECSDFCDGYAMFSDLCYGDTPEKAIDKWNEQKAKYTNLIKKE